MKTLYYIAIDRNEKRDFTYSKEILTREVDDKEYNAYDFKDKGVALITRPQEHLIILISYDKKYIECCRLGIGVEQQKYNLWNEMYDEYIDYKNAEIS